MSRGVRKARAPEHHDGLARSMFSPLLGETESACVEPRVCFLAATASRCFVPTFSQPSTHPPIKPHATPPTPPPPVFCRR